MRDAIFHIERGGPSSLQSQIRELMVTAILNGQLPPGESIPSSRRMAESLGVSRNSVSLVYQSLVDDGYLISRERSGFFVNSDLDIVHLGPQPKRTAPRAPTGEPVDWTERQQLDFSDHVQFVRPANWQKYPYPFIYGQVDQGLFPLAAWRECSRQALGRKGMDVWTSDTYALDDPMLIEQIRSRLLPRRGILAGEDEVLVTLGAQNALYLVASLLVREDTTVGIEEPGYQDAHNIMSLKTRNLRPLDVDEKGLDPTGPLAGCDYVYTTPSHHYPTTVTLPMERRKALLERAVKDNFIILEDDYEFETNYMSTPIPALKSLDTDGRVIYIGSLSKTLFPGLRLGFMIAPAPLIASLRRLRQLMYRHPPNNNQRTAALFLSLGYHDALVHKLNRAYKDRWACLGAALDKYMPNMSKAPPFGGTSYWVEGPKKLNAQAVYEAALEEGVVIEPGQACFLRTPRPTNVFRLGFSSIPLERIEGGIEILARLIRNA
ncbi:MAG: PLP-dependent aminotransferase family protein [Rhodospirillales bacterium]